MTLRFPQGVLDLSRPVVMGILNVTPDSFYDGGNYSTELESLHRAEQMLKDGAAILDVGGMSSRPGAETVSESEELSRTVPAIERINRHFPEAFISIDTWRASVAAAALDAGAGMVNDISGGKFDNNLWPLVASRQVPYVLMHMQGKPQTMQQHPEYQDVVLDLLDFFIEKTNALHEIGIHEILIDPGFGFGKTLQHNYRLLQEMNLFQRVLQIPIVAGISRKSMICKALGVQPAHALNGTTALHMAALERGASVLRAHDVKEAMEVIRLWEYLDGCA